jgi:hypothetical protein
VQTRSLSNGCNVPIKAGMNDLWRNESGISISIHFREQQVLENSPDQLRVEIVGGVIFLRVEGPISEAVIRRRHDLMLQSCDASGLKCILFDVRYAHSPSEAARGLQHQLNGQIISRNLRLAVVVSDSATAFLARQTFFGSYHRIFYDDVASGAKWLRESGASD